MYNNGISKNDKISKNSDQNNIEAVTNENDKEVHKERYISLEERQKILDNGLTDQLTSYHRPQTNRPSNNKKYEDQKFHNKFLTIIKSEIKSV